MVERGQELENRRRIFILFADGVIWDCVPEPREGFKVESYFFLINM